MLGGRLFHKSGTIWKPKNPHSLEYLKYLHGLLLKNETVTDQNRSLLVEALRSISEILIWGDQNDATVFDFFLEKNMLEFFLKIMKQKCGSYVCVQLLQTLNIMFENIRHATSLYYLLSNNHVNSIITHRFDFSDEEIMAYYISFLKTLSFKLNSNTIHFFFNEQTNDFPLYTEAIKFFNHSESMVRIAVRTLTLNVYKVCDSAMLKFIRDKTAAPYFSNLVWFIGNHIAEMDRHIQSDSTVSRDKLEDLIAEHLDHIHYVNDILCLGIEPLNEVLTEHLVQRLFLSVYLGSLAPHLNNGPHVSKVLALFLMTQVFLIICYQPLVEQLLSLLFFGDADDLRGPPAAGISSSSSKDTSISSDLASSVTDEKMIESRKGSDTVAVVDDSLVANCTDEEKLKRQVTRTSSSASSLSRGSLDMEKKNRPLFAALLALMDCTGTDHGAFYALTLLYGVGQNEGIPTCLLEAAQLSNKNSVDSKFCCDRNVLQKLIAIFSMSCESDSQVRLVTVEMAALVLRQLVLADENGSFLQDAFYAQLVGAKEMITSQLATFFKAEDMFLDLFEDEYQSFQRSDLKVHMLSTDGPMLQPPSCTPFSGVEFSKRLPCGPQEQARRVIRVYFLLRQLLLDLDGVPETRLPLSKPCDCVYVNDCLNLNNSDLLSCTVLLKNNSRAQRFLVTDGLQLILVEPDGKRLGWGQVKFVGFLQDVELTGDKDDSRSLQVTVHQASSKTKSGNSQPLLTSKFIFDDHIRCMAAKQRLTKGRLKARQYKMDLIADMLEIPKRDSISPAVAGPTTSPLVFRSMKTWKGKAPGSASCLNSSQGSSRLEKETPLPNSTDDSAPSFTAPISTLSSAEEKSPQRKAKAKKSTGESPVTEIPLQDLSKKSPTTEECAIPSAATEEAEDLTGTAENMNSVTSTESEKTLTPSSAESEGNNYGELPFENDGEDEGRRRRTHTAKSVLPAVSLLESIASTMVPTSAPTEKSSRKSNNSASLEISVNDGESAEAELPNYTEPERTVTQRFVAPQTKQKSKNSVIEDI